MADQVEEVKNKVDIVELVQEYLPLKKAGRNYKTNCPFHGEKTPSFMVNPELQIFKCFGCAAGGDVFEFLKRMEGMEFGEALQHLANKVGITLTTFKPSAFEQQRDQLISINTKAAEYYHYLLTKHRLGEEARKYLEARDIKEEAVERFKLGYAPEGWDFVTKYLVDKKGYKLFDLERTGLIIKGNNYYDRFRNRVMFPLNNARGQTLGFAGRVMPPSAKATEGQASQVNQQAKYVNTPETEIYHKGELLFGLDVNRSEIKTKGWVVVVEGEVDCIASWQANVKNVVAIKGSALTERQVELLRRLGETIVLGLDADVAGDAAARRGIEIAHKQGMIVKMIRPSEKYKDPGEWATRDAPSWQAAVEGAIPIHDFYLESAVKRYGLDAVGKTKIGRELLPIWANINDEILKAHYIQQLANVLQVSETDVRVQLGKIKSGSQPPSFAKATEGSSRSNTRREVMEEYVVGLALRHDRSNKLREIKELFKSSFWVRVIEQLGISDLGSREIVNKLPAELKERVENLFLQEDEGDVDKEWKKATEKLEEIEIREKIEELKGRDEPKKMVKLTARLAELTRPV